MAGTDGLPDDGLGPARARRRVPARLLLGLAAVETLTLLLLLVNLLVVDRSSTLAAALGPVHGACYLAGVLLTWLAPFSRRVKVVAVVPVVGAWVAALRARSLGQEGDVRRSVVHPSERSR